VLKHFAIFSHLRRISFLSDLYNTTSYPFSMLDFLSLEFASFLCNNEKGEEGLALSINRKWKGLRKCCKLALDSVNCLNYFCRSLWVRQGKELIQLPPTIDIINFMSTSSRAITSVVWRYKRDNWRINSIFCFNISRQRNIIIRRQCLFLEAIAK